MKILVAFFILVSACSGFAFAEPDVSASISNDDSTLYVDKQIMIVADVKNGQDVIQPFAYITQVKNDQNVVVSLSWLTGSLSPRQSFSPAQSWTPIVSGTYTIEVYVWKSIDNPDALSPPLSMTVTVVNSAA